MCWIHCGGVRKTFGELRIWTRETKRMKTKTLVKVVGVRRVRRGMIATTAAAAAAVVLLLHAHLPKG
jgi:hypothetical protein